MSKLNTWNDLESSFIKRYKYNGADLLIQFSDGKMFKYGGVPWKKVNELAKAKSSGAYFKTHIAKDHPFEEIKDKQQGNSHESHSDIGAQST